MEWWESFRSDVPIYLSAAEAREVADQFGASREGRRVMSIYITATAAEPRVCFCGATIKVGEDYVVDTDGRVCGYECGCGDPHYADGESER